MRTRVLVADGSPFCRRLLCDWIRADSEFECLPPASSLAETLQSAKQLQPDVLCLDIAAWGEKGLDCLREIMLRTPIKTLVMSSPTADGSTIAFEAVGAGAIEYFAKPYSNPSFRIAASRSRFLEMLHLVSVATLPGDRRQPPEVNRTYGVIERIVAIIGNAGGPRSLERLFKAWPASDLASIFVLQAVPKGYEAALLRRINYIGGVPICDAIDGATINPGRALLLPMGQRMEFLATRHIRLIPSARQNDPLADDVLVQLASRFGPEVVAIFISGTGNDGLAGAAAVQQAGGAVLVESESSATVPELARRLRSAGLVDGEAVAEHLPAASAAFGSHIRKRAG